MMSKETICPVVRDLLPSYLEKMTEDATNQFIERHLAECEACRAARQAMLGGDSPDQKAQSELIEGLRRARLRRKRMIRCALVLAVVLLAVSLLPLPIRVDREIEAYLWGAGQPQKEDRLVQVRIDGYYMRHLFFDDYFDGDIAIEGIAITQKEGSLMRYEIKRDGSMGLFYQDKEGMAVDVGSGCVLPGLEGFVFALYDEPSENGTQSWYSTSSLMLTYPARTRKEAIEKSHEISTSQGHWLEDIHWGGMAYGLE